ncbi:MAG TPA: helix-turn-helix domain-containing protein [Solirubrobacteraceae bacterium]|nr:helix-turn-helix domain-containing protein [Solirubrobacteraceae bacterium]
MAHGTKPTALPPDLLTTLAETIDVQALSAQLTEVMLDEVYADVIDAAVLRDLLQSATAEKVACLKRLVAGGITLDEVQAPASLIFAAEVARQGISEQIFERSYRVGQATLWEWWTSAVEAHCVDRAAALEVIRCSIPTLFGFVDRLLFASLGSYHAAVAQRHQTLEHRRLRLVEQVLDGTLDTPAAEAQRFLGYAFDGHHLGGVLDTPDTAADRQLTAALKEIGNAGDLLVLEGAGPTEFWLRLRAPLTAALRSRLHAAAAQTGRRVAFGAVGPGLAGFRQTIETARDAATVQAMLGDHAARVTWAEDVRIEMLALRDRNGARALVRDELGIALDAGLLTPRMRETLQAWLLSGSYVAAAAILGVHEQTIRQRLRRLEGALGRPLNDRRTELHVALRLSLLTLSPDGRSNR